MPKEIYPMEEDWDYLLLLDACRYDYFKELYRDYFEGKLRKVISPGSETSEWCRKVFTGFYEDVIYVSANPRINSKIEVRGFDASEHFYKVIDVWEHGWDSRLGTVRPEKVNEVSIMVKEGYPGKKLIIHYLQPHAPYLVFERTGHGIAKDPQNHKLGFKDKRLRSLLGPKIRDILGGRLTRKLRDFLGLEPTGPLEATLREVGVEKLKELYENNLDAVLQSVAKLSEGLSGKIVITADHGELLGEEGYFAHPRGKGISILKEIPWFELEGVADRTSVSSEKGRIKSIIQKIKEKKEIQVILNDLRKKQKGICRGHICIQKFQLSLQL